MLERLEARLADLLRIPPQPDPPAGSQGSARVFRAARNYYRYRLALWGFKQLGAVAGIVIFLLFTYPPLAETLASVPWEKLRVPEEAAENLRKVLLHIGRLEEFEHPIVAFFMKLEWFGLGLYLLQIPLTFLAVRLDYRMRWYILTDRSLRIREGVQRVREVTMTFANIQHVTVRQGPIQRLLRLADLEVRTAGGGATKGPYGEFEDKRDSVHVAYFRGVDNADEIRDEILRHLKRLRDAGLGDPDDAAAPEPSAAMPGLAFEEALLAAARTLRDEARALAETARGISG